MSMSDTKVMDCVGFSNFKDRACWAEVFDFMPHDDDIQFRPVFVEPEKALSLHPLFRCGDSYLDLSQYLLDHQKSNDAEIAKQIEAEHQLRLERKAELAQAEQEMHARHARQRQQRIDEHNKYVATIIELKREYEFPKSQVQIAGKGLEIKDFTGIDVDGWLSKHFVGLVVEMLSPWLRERMMALVNSWLLSGTWGAKV